MTPTDPEPGTGTFGAELARPDKRRRLRTGLLHGYGAAVLAFGPSLVKDTFAAAGAQASSVPVLVEVTACLAACGWMTWCAWRRPLRDRSSRSETWVYGALAAAVIGSLAIETCVDDQGAVLEAVRSVVSLTLVVRLVLARGNSVRDIVRGELIRPRDHEAADLPRQPGDRWAFSFMVIMFGLAASTLAKWLLLTWVPVLVHGTMPTPGPGLEDWVATLRAGPVEELVACAGLVLALEYAGRPVWMIYASTLALRVSYHLWIGIPGCLTVLPLAAAATWAYRRWRSPSALVLGHTAWDVVITIVQHGV